MGFSLMEGLWILCGSEDVAPLSYFTPHIKEFSDNGITFNAPYGHRLRRYPPYTIDQLEYCYRTLKADPDSRQAVMTIWHPYKDEQETRDHPCTNWLHFLIRDNKLDFTVQMRGNDLLWGTPYNVFNFMLIQEVMAGWLGIELGTYTHQVNSMHFYEDKMDVVARIMGSREYNIDPYYSPSMIWDARCPKEQFDVFEKEMRELINHIGTEHFDYAVCNVSIPNEYWKNYTEAIVARKFINEEVYDVALDITNDMLDSEFKLSLYRSLFRKNKILREELLDMYPESLVDFLCEDPKVINERAKQWLAKQ